MSLTDSQSTTNVQKIQASFRPVIFPQDATLLFGTATAGGGEATQISWKPTYAQNNNLLSPLHALAMITFYPQVNIRVTGEHFLTILGPRTRLEAHFYPFFIWMISGRTQLFTPSESSPGRLVP